MGLTDMILSNVWQDRGFLNGKTSDRGFDFNASIVYGMAYALNQPIALQLEEQSFEENYIVGDRDSVEKRCEKNRRKHIRRGGKFINHSPVPFPNCFDIKNQYAKDAVSNFSALCEKYGLEQTHAVQDDLVPVWTDPYDNRNCLMAKRKKHTFSAKATVTPDMFEKHFNSIWKIFDRIRGYEELQRIAEYLIGVLKTVDKPEIYNSSFGLPFECTGEQCGFQYRECWAHFKDYGFEPAYNEYIIRAISIFMLSQITTKLVDENTGKQLWTIPNDLSCRGWDQLGMSERPKGCVIPLEYCGEIKRYKSW